MHPNQPTNGTPSRTPAEIEQDDFVRRAVRIAAELPEIEALRDVPTSGALRGMAAYRWDEVVKRDGELLLTDLPCRKGDRVEIILLVPDAAREKERTEALARILEMAKRIKLRPGPPLPKREELYDRV